MAFYRLDFDSAPATESDRTTFATNERCFECGSNGPRVSSQFLVPEDSVETLVVEVFDDFPPPLFEASGLLVAADWIVAELSAEFITGFERRPVTILSGANSDEILGFSWISITGRCTTHPVWHRAMFRCPICRHARTESVTAQHRRVIILPPVPTVDIFRSSERAAGVMVSEKLRELFATSLGRNGDSGSKFLPVTVDT